MNSYCPQCGATENNGGGCRYCDPRKVTTRFAKTEVTFGPVGRALWSAVTVGLGFVAFAFVRQVLDDKPHAWWVLLAWLLLAAPLVLHDLWRPVRRINTRR